MTRNETIAALESRLSDLQGKNKKVRPDDKKYKEEDRSMKKKIDDCRLKLAELRYEQEHISSSCDVFREKQTEMRKKLEECTVVLKQRKGESSKMNAELNATLGSDKGLPKEIPNPEEKLVELTNALNNEKSRLRTDDLTTGEEKKSMRRIKLLEIQVSKVKEYVSKDVSELFKKKKEKQSNVNEVRRKHDNAYKDFQKARSEANEQFNKLTENKNSQEETSAEIDRLQGDRNRLEKKFKRDMEDWQDWNRRVRELRQKIQAKKEQQEYASHAASSRASKPDTATASIEKKASAESSKRETAEKEVQSVEERRKAALLEYERCKRELEKKQQTAAPVVGGETTTDGAMSIMKKADDPHLVEKDLCRQLIVYCQTNLPDKSDSPSKGKKKKRKKKRKIRLTHKPINFTNFAKVGVGIPIWSTDLEECIKKLEAKIISYDNAAAQETEEEEVEAAV